MKLIFRCLFLLVLFCCGTKPGWSCELNVRTYEFAPFALKDVHGHWSGIDIEYTKVLLDHVGCRYHFVEVPWGRGLEMLKSGEIDLMLNVTKTAERANYIHFVGPQRLEILRFVSLKESIAPIAQWDQLWSIKAPLMRQRGTYIGPKFEQMLTEHPEVAKRLIYLPNTVTRIDFLRKGRAVGFFAEQAYLQNEFDKNPDYSILKVHPIIINKAPVYYGFSKASMTKKQIANLHQGYQQLYKLKKIQEVEGHYDLY